MQGTKNGCGEGGCGACSVQVHNLDINTGKQAAGISTPRCCCRSYTSLTAAGKINTKCINSCLCPVGSLDGCSVVTVEGMGNAQIGFNAVQGVYQPRSHVSFQQNFVAVLMFVLGFAERIAGFHGSQCGFCTPGMVVACHTALSIAKSKGEKCTPMQIEKAFDGNLCRCTGYRPILDGCKVRR